MLRFLALVFLIGVVSANPIEEVLRAHKTRIHHGVPTKIRNAPYQVAIVDLMNDRLCGGSIVSSEYILTAAHCAESPVDNYFVISGTSFWQNGMPRQVVKAVSHEGYSADDIKPVDDVALMKVSPPFKFDSKLTKPIELFGKDEKVEAGQEAFVTGWGINEKGKVPNHLQGLTVNIIDKNECDKGYNFVNGTHENQLCATHPTEAKDFCKGDSGGPLVIDGRQAGIVSWNGPGCAIPGRPGVYTNVAAYRDWIDQHMRE